jgi:hypothetical protein
MAFPTDCVRYPFETSKLVVAYFFSSEGLDLLPNLKLPPLYHSLRLS